ncbi:hypothetical protein PGH07_03025 [Sulfurovum sp. zt1-1]|uniref:Carbamoyltransferase Kae1-like domain-containing protein n=1 Tax=Sulfurovum zhangzhouensis TaxID=3019067 RepID=A0ABT7QWH1_9BACT|nr:hypothetical protein [Sulfurovum zhangzhouensis]MDM5271138.1 hypothetical protein [Sulfurovum zhangzhouensis]
MNIAFNFHYTHHNGLMTRLLNEIKRDTQIPVYLAQNENQYTLEASGEQTTLEELAEVVSNRIPLSLFLKEYRLGETQTIKGSDQFLEDTSGFYQLPYCPKCQEGILQRTLQTFGDCSVCGSSHPEITFDAWLDHYHATDFYELIESKVEELLDKRVMQFQTLNSNRTFSLDEISQDSHYGILCCDVNAIADSFVITPSELHTLTLVEKPSLRLKPKLHFRLNHELKSHWYSLFLADDLITLAVSQILASKNIDFVFVSNPPLLRCAVAMEQPFIIQTGRDLLPLSYSKTLPFLSQCNAYGFYAANNHDKIEIDYTDNPSDLLSSHITYVPWGSELTEKGKVFFEPAHAALTSVMMENDLFDRSLLGVHLSHQTKSEIFSYSPQIGYTSMVKFKSHHKQPSEILTAIASIEESAQRLIQNFSTHYPDLYQKLHFFEFDELNTVEPITELFGLAAMILGIYDGNSIVDAAGALEANAIEFRGKSGPRIDYKVHQRNGEYYLDTLTTLRSAISFKLAGVDDMLLSFGFIDSLADFIAQQAQNAYANIGIEGVTISGNVFENRQLLKHTYQNVSPNYTLYSNIRLSMDSDNIVMGALMLGNHPKG